MAWDSLFHEDLSVNIVNTWALTLWTPGLLTLWTPVHFLYIWVWWSVFLFSLTIACSLQLTQSEHQVHIPSSHSVPILTLSTHTQAHSRSYHKIYCSFNYLNLYVVVLGIWFNYLNTWFVMISRSCTNRFNYLNSQGRPLALKFFSFMNIYFLSHVISSI